VRCPHSRGDGALTGELLSSTGSVSCPLVTGFSLIPPDGAPPPWGFALPGPARVPEVTASGLALEAADALLLVEEAAHRLPGLRPTARPLHTRVRDAAARALLSASGAPTTRAGLLPPHQG